VWKITEVLQTQHTIYLVNKIIATQQEKFTLNYTIFTILHHKNYYLRTGAAKHPVYRQRLNMIVVAPSIRATPLMLVGWTDMPTMACP
jgi:hypothetical protein